MYVLLLRTNMSKKLTNLSIISAVVNRGLLESVDEVSIRETPLSWHIVIVDGIGDGAFFLRAIARNVYGNPDDHMRARYEVLAYISEIQIIITRIVAPA